MSLKLHHAAPGARVNDEQHSIWHQWVKNETKDRMSLFRFMTGFTKSDRLVVIILMVGDRYNNNGESWWPGMNYSWSQTVWSSVAAGREHCRWGWECKQYSNPSNPNLGVLPPPQKNDFLDTISRILVHFGATCLTWKMQKPFWFSMNSHLHDLHKTVHSN